jgi:predicted enzyme related to lactoylglutathione lyase
MVIRLKGAILMGQPVVHFEIGCRDAATTHAFYSNLFDWKIEPYGPAGMIATGNTSGIQGHINSLGHEPHQYVTVYVQVDDLQAYLNKAGQLGGKTLVPPTEVPGMGHFAWMADPGGNIVGLWKPLARG